MRKYWISLIGVSILCILTFLFTACNLFNPQKSVTKNGTNNALQNGAVNKDHVLPINENQKIAMEITLVTDDWEPYTSKTLKNNGVAAEIVRAAFNEVGYKVKYEFYPWKRCEALVENGEVYAAIPYSKNEDRVKRFNFSDEFVKIKNVFVYKKGGKIAESNFDYHTLYELKGYKIGIVRGYAYEKTFLDAGLDVELLSKEDSALEMLHSGRVDILINEQTMLMSQIKRKFPSEVESFKFLNTPYGENYLHCMYSRKYPNALQINEQFNKGLKQIKEKGIYSDLLTEYLLTSSKV